MPNTVTVTNGSREVVGDVTGFVGAAGDLFLLFGLAMEIASVDSTSHLTLDQPWPGATLSGVVPWKIRRDGPQSRSVVALNAKLAEWIPSAEGLRDAIDGKQDALGFGPVQQGGGVGQGNDKVKIGWGVEGYPGLRGQVNTVDLGQIWTDFTSGRGGAGPVWEKLPNGLIIQGGQVPDTGSVADVGVSFPLAFPSAGYSIVATPAVPNLPAGAAVAVAIDTLSAIGFTMRRRVITSGGVAVSGVPVLWLAWGR